MFLRSLFLVGLIFFILSLAILAFIFLLPQPPWSPAAVLLTPLNPRLSGGGAPCLQAQDLVIDKYWPDQLDLNTSDTIRVLLIKRQAGSFSIATSTTGTHKAAEETPQSPIDFGTPVPNCGINLPTALGPANPLFATAHLVATTFNIQSIGPEERPFDTSNAVDGVEWDWNISPKTLGTQLLNIDKEREGKTKEASQNVDGTGERPPPPVASLSDPLSSTHDSPAMTVTNTPGDHRGSPSTSAVSSATQLDELSQRANAYYRDLQVYSREHAPAEWAATQNKLGVTLVAQARLVEGPERHNLFTQAVTAYRSSLEVLTPESAPTQWAIGQSNLGNAISALAQLTKGSEQHDLLTQAATAYHAALQIYTPERTPAQWARARMHLAHVQLMMAWFEHNAESRCAMLQGASQSVEDALSFFRQEGNSVFSQQAIQLYRTIQEQIQASGCHFAAESEG